MDDISETSRDPELLPKFYGSFQPSNMLPGLVNIQKNDGKSPFLNRTIIMGYSMIYPLVNIQKNNGKSPCYEWVNQRTKSPFSIANC
jgi:hypothetical protein